MAYDQRQFFLTETANPFDAGYEAQEQIKKPIMGQGVLNSFLSYDNCLARSLYHQ